MATLTKYCNQSSYGYNGFVDGKTELDPEDDAAYVNWGPSWRIPTYSQLGELISKCTSEWIQLNNVNGRLFTGPNGNTLFFPAAGRWWKNSRYGAGLYVYAWSRTLNSYQTFDALYLYFGSEEMNCSTIHRCYGFPVRAVRVQ